MKIETFLKQDVDYLNSHPWNLRGFLAKYLRVIVAPFYMFWGYMVLDVFPTKKNIKKRGILKSLAILGGVMLLLFIMVGEFSRGFEGSFGMMIVNFIYRAALIMIGFGILMVIVLSTHVDERMRQKTIRKRRRMGGGMINFSGKVYSEAAKALRNFKAISFEKAKQKYSPEVLDLLIIGGGLYFYKEGSILKTLMVRRLVSIKSIEENREAGWED